MINEFENDSINIEREKKMDCKAKDDIIKQQGNEAVYIKTEDGYCPTALYYHLQSCDTCEKSRWLQLEYGKRERA